LFLVQRPNNKNEDMVFELEGGEQPLLFRLRAVYEQDGRKIGVGGDLCLVPDYVHEEEEEEEEEEGLLLGLLTINTDQFMSELFRPGHFVGLGLRLKSKIRTRTFRNRYFPTP
jgi:hypothetical protein